MNSPEQQLADLAARIREVVRATGGSARPPSAVHAVSLANFFSVQVARGGFAQLIYNAGGQYLQDLEAMLVAAGAGRARLFYARAIQLCLRDQDAYQAFLASPFTDDGALKNSLHEISVEYLRGEPQFADEASAFVTASEAPVAQWIESLV